MRGNRSGVPGGGYSRADRGRLPRLCAGRLRAVTVLAVLAITMLAGCSSSTDPLASDYYGGTGGYGEKATIAEFPANERGEPVSFAGPLDIGGEVSSEEYLGKVLVLNFWYAGCPPCRAEAKDLQAVNQHFLDESAEVAFLGINTEDGAATARSFAETFGVTYPSILDATDNEVRLAFAGAMPASAIPTTLVLDREGRVAARILGILQEASILRTIVQDVLDEEAAGDSAAGGAAGDTVRAGAAADTAAAGDRVGTVARTSTPGTTAKISGS